MSEDKTMLVALNVQRRSRMPFSAAVMLLLLLASWSPGLSGSARAAEIAQQAQRAGVGCTLTLSRTEGPYWRSGSPERTNLIESGMVGARVTITGYVYDTNCQPIANAWVDFWQTDYFGVYDNTGYILRGHQYTDATGRYQLQTIVPGEYPGRTIHIHVKVQAPGGPVLTTQIFFPDVAHNSSDGIFHPSLAVSLENTPQGKTARYNFVVTSPTLAPAPVGKDSHLFKETGFTVSGRFWQFWQGGRTFEDSVYINGYPITPVRDEISPTDGKPYATQWFERARFESHPENPAPNDVLLGLLGTYAARGRENEAPFKPVANPGGRAQWFAQTGHTLGDFSGGGLAIITYWSQRGDVRQFGLPVTEPFIETRGDGASYLVQYFERQRFEYHPEYKGTRYEILLGQLGTEQAPK
jgi:protocatechuate 3,4-dioxygenase beta subunit